MLLFSLGVSIIDDCTVYTLQCTVHSTVYSTLYSVQYTLQCTVHSTVYSILYCVHTATRIAVPAGYSSIADSCDAVTNMMAAGQPGQRNNLSWDVPKGGFLTLFSALASCWH